MAAADWRCSVDTKDQTFRPNPSRVQSPYGKTSPLPFTVTRSYALEEMEVAGTTEAGSGYPHEFGGNSGATSGIQEDGYQENDNTKKKKIVVNRLKFYGVDARCNKDDTALLEYPVYNIERGRPQMRWKRELDANKQMRTPARLVYLADGSALCGIVTHVLATTEYKGEGGFRVCNSDTYTMPVRGGWSDVPEDDAARFNMKIIPAARGYAFDVRAGERFRIVDLEGEQIVDFAAWVQGTDLVEKLSMSYTRYHLSGVTPAIGECLWTNKDEPILRLEKDTVKVHDMTFMSCFPELYEKQGLKGHRSCASNIAEVMAPYGMSSYLEVTDPFNIFQNTPNYSLKRLGSSKAGDHVEFTALKDIICAASVCPYDLDGVNGGKITDIGVMTELQKRDA